MSLLIRFEDTYGMCDIFSSSRHLPFLSNTDRGKIIHIMDNVYIQYGLSSPNCIILQERELVSFRKLGVTSVLFVFDIDNGEGRNYDVWSYDSLKGLVDNLNNPLNGNDIKFYFLPTIYCAETVLLYNYIDSECIGSLFAEDLVSTHDINKFYKYLIAMLEGIRSTKKVKVFREYADIDSLIKVLGKVVTFEGYLPNRKCFNWLIDGCPVDPLETGYFYTASEFLAFYEDFVHRFENRRCMDFIVEGKDFQYTINTDITIEDMVKLYLESLSQSKSK